MNIKDIKHKIKTFILQIVTFRMLDSLKYNEDTERAYIKKQERRGIFLCSSCDMS